MINKYEIKGSLAGGLHLHTADIATQPLFYHVVLTLSDDRMNDMLHDARRSPKGFFDEEELLELIREKLGNDEAEMPIDPITEYPELVIAEMLRFSIPWPTTHDFREVMTTMKTIAEKYDEKVNDTEMFVFSCRPVSD